MLLRDHLTGDSFVFASAEIQLEEEAKADMDDHQIGALIIGFSIAVLSAVIYIIPMLVARGKKNRSAIVVLNLLLGWTFLGWVGALIWAMVSPKEAQSPISA